MNELQDRLHHHLSSEASRLPDLAGDLDGVLDASEHPDSSTRRRSPFAISDRFMTKRTVFGVVGALVVSVVVAIPVGMAVFGEDSEGASAEAVASESSGVSVVAAGDPERLFEFDMTSNLAVVAGGHAVFVADSVEPATPREVKGFVVQEWTVTVKEVLFQAPSPLIDVANDNKEVEFPRLNPGDRLVVDEIYDAKLKPDFDLVGSSDLLISVSFVDPERVNTGSPWTLKVVAEIDAARNLRFIHSQHGAAWDEQYARLMTELKSQESQADVLAQWAAELWADTEGAGPIATAFFAANAPPDPVDVWLSLDPTERALDPEFTPEAVLADLIEVPVLIEVDDDARISDRFLIVRTSLGVLHTARLEGGSHPTSFLTPPNGDWELWISDAPVGGSETMLGRIDASEWKDLESGSQALITITGDAVQSAEPTDAGSLFSIVDRDQAAQIMQSWVD